MLITQLKSPIIIDGGTGTELERLGVPMNSKAWSAEAVLLHPKILRDVHEAFIDAGAEIVIANTFSSALHNLEAAGFADRFEEINSNAVQLVREAIERSGREAVTAAGISTTTFTGALDASRLPSGDAAVAQYARQAGIMVEAGAELIILEMMRDVDQTNYALEGALSAGAPVWIGFTCFTDEDGGVYLLDTDIPLEQALKEVPLHKGAAVGIMHTLVEHAPAAVDELMEHWGGMTFSYPHAGHFVMPNWHFNDATTPDDFAEAGLALFDKGVDAVGGCCGITPKHIRALAERVRDRKRASEDS